MAFGLIGGLKTKKGRTFGRFSTTPENYDVTNKFYFSDGSGEVSWEAFYSATGSFYDNFDVYDTENDWNEVIVGAATITATGGVLTLDDGAVGDDNAQIYSVFLTKTLREAGTITMEIRLRRNTQVDGSLQGSFYLGKTFAAEDLPVACFGFDTSGTSNDVLRGIKRVGSTTTSLGTFACTNNTWHTYKIVMEDGATPTGKLYMDNVLQISTTLDKTFRDMTFFSGAMVYNQSDANTNTLEITWVKVTD